MQQLLIAAGLSAAISFTAGWSVNGWRLGEQMARDEVVREAEEKRQLREVIEERDALQAINAEISADLETILPAIFLLMLSSCSTLPRLEVVRPAPARPDATLLSKCPPTLETTKATSLSQLEQTELMIRWAAQYHDCAAIHNALVDWFEVRD